jgi:hypothetical protein
MRYEVYLEFTDGFTLDSPQKGVLDVDQLGYLTQQVDAPIYSINAQRGKSRELEKYTTGSCVIVFDNRDRFFEPSQSISPEPTDVYPGRRISVKMFNTKTNSYARDVFNGYTNDWVYDYSMSGDSTATVSCVDAFSILANKEIVNPIVCPAETSGKRILRILANGQVSFPAGDAVIDDGNTILAAENVTGNALQYLQKVELTEQGQLFVDGTGNLRFLERQIARSNPIGFSNYLPQDLNFYDIELAFSNDSLVNFLEATASVGTAVASNPNSINDYQIRSQQYETLHNNFTDLENFADYIVDQYSEPEYRIKSLSFNLQTPPFPSSNLPEKIKNDIFKIFLDRTDIGNQARPRFYPGAVTVPLEGSPIDPGDAWISGITHDISLNRHDITLNFTKAIGLLYFRLDDRQFGILDRNVLGY